MIVVDTNVIAYLYLASERSLQAENALKRDTMWAAPVLWRSELQNVLAHYIRRQQMTVEDAIRIMDEAARLMVGGEYRVAPHQVLSLVAKSTCSAYDCEFVALARDLAVLLVTADSQILDQFPDTAVSLDEYSAV